LIPKPPSSRNQLEWAHFERKESGDDVLNLPPYYASLFEMKEKEIMKKSNTGWRDSKTGKTKFAYFIDLEDNEKERIKSFITDYKQYVIIGINKNIEAYYSDELDSCIAIDYNLETSEKRTPLGELEYQAKYKENEEAMIKLSKYLKEALIKITRGFEGGKKCISYIPYGPDKKFYLPKILAEKIVNLLDEAFFNSNEKLLIHTKLTKKKKSSKDSPLNNKIKEWDTIISNEFINLSQSVEGFEVYVIDDLYQSGTSLWSFAKYLKSVGASAVHGLVCVKSWRDRNNI